MSDWFSGIGIKLVGDTSEAPPGFTEVAHWQCVQGHKFSMRRASLGRRVRCSASPCPDCEELIRDTERRTREYEQVVAKAKESGLTVTDGLATYQDQKSKLRVRCSRCDSCLQPPVAADKLKQGQGCRQLGLIRRSATRRKSFADVQQIVASHPDGLTLLSGPDDYQNNRSPLSFRCIEGHEFPAPLDRIQRKSRPVGCPYCSTSLGQTVASAVATTLLAVTPRIESSPPFLIEDWDPSRKPLRFDAFFEGVAVGDERYCVALEYQGRQHRNPTHYYHQNAVRGPTEAFKLLRQGDAHKVAACSRQPNTALVLVHEPEEKMSLDLVFQDVVSAIEDSLPALTMDPGYQARLAELRTSRLDEVVKEFRIHTASFTRLCSVLNQKEIDVVTWDPLAKTAECQCRRDGNRWIAKIGNLLGGVNVDRKGTGCPVCKGRLTGKRKRLKEDEVIRRAADLDWLPLWTPGSYTGRKQILRWKCASLACDQTREMDLDHVLRGQCRCHRRDTL
jgi:hypothetical protein